MKFSPKLRRNIVRIIPFGVIWWIMGLVFILVETAAMGTASPDSTTIINLTLEVIIFASIAIIFVGLLVGFLEIIILENYFRHKSFPQKVLYKFGLYALFALVIISITYPIAASFEASLPISDARIWQKFGDYLGSITFLSTLLQISSSILVSLFYAAISENLGHTVLTNFFTGKYHKPKEEKRIFMFLDMTSSTTIAEKLGHIRYFDLLREYYSDFSDAIINHSGEVYQYIGDEIVLSWKAPNGLDQLDCIKCFFAMKKDLQNREKFYLQKFGLMPSFKAGLHIGEVTTGEIGALKKEIFYTGDVLNTTARIQSMCKQFNAELLISRALMEHFPTTEDIRAQFLESAILRGKSKPIDLFRIDAIKG